MSDHSISIVPKVSQYPGKQQRVHEVLQWLIAEKIVEPNLSGCTLGLGDSGYAVVSGAKNVVNEPGYLPFDLITNGMEIITEKTIFHAGQNGVEQLICPACGENLVDEDWDFFGMWQEQDGNDIICPLCNAVSDIQAFTFEPAWGFSDVGFIFWNWPEFTDSFIAEFKQKLCCDINVVHNWI